MPSYSYKATDAYGNLESGILEVDSEADAVKAIQDAGNIPIKITLQKKGGGVSGVSFQGASFLPNFRSVPVRSVMTFTQDFSGLLKAGLPIDKSLRVLIDVAENKTMKSVLADILERVESGSGIADAMGEHREAFSEFYVNMVRSGEAGGVLEPVLSRLAVFLEQSQELKDHIRSALVYPVFLLLVGGASIIILMTFVIPRFASMFDDMGSTLPWSTRLILTISDGLKNHWAWWLAGVALIYVLFRYYCATEKGRHIIDTLKLKLPVFGPLLQKIEIARFARTLGTLMQSGVPILNALDLTRDIIVNTIISGRMIDVQKRVKEGAKLSVPLNDIPEFPMLAVQMITVGEETGQLAVMLSRIADNYENAVRIQVKRAMSLMEPVMILSMGVVIGFIVISMLLAIFSMNDMAF